MKVNIFPRKSWLFWVFNHLSIYLFFKNLFFFETSLDKVNNFFRCLWILTLILKCILKFFSHFFFLNFIISFCYLGSCGCFSNNKFKKYTANRVNIAFISMIPIFDLLRRSILLRRRSCFLFRVSFFSGRSEVTKFNLSFAVRQYIFWLQIPMNNSFFIKLTIGSQNLFDYL